RGLIKRRLVQQNRLYRPIPSQNHNQAPSIRVHHACHAVYYILHLSRVPLWLAAYLSRMPLALLTNHKPEPHVMRLPSESTTLATPLIIYCISSMSFSGSLPTFPACHWIAERHGIG
uniref:Secreted protein n=1 Tax=Mesocestoides corti TaxID=53468 RepID=A0A5K3EY24_MESCO